MKKIHYYSELFTCRKPRARLNGLRTKRKVFVRESSTFFLFEAAAYLFVVFVCDRTHVFVVVVATNVFVDAVRDSNFLITP